MDPQIAQFKEDDATYRSYASHATYMSHPLLPNLR